MLDGFTPWSADRAERYRKLGHWRGHPLGSLLRDRAAATPGKLALVAGETRLSYAELDTAADRLAAGLAELGFAPGDRLLVQLPNVAEFVTLCFAAFRLGVIPVLIPPAHRIAEVGALAELSGAVGYVIPDRFGGFDYRAPARELRDRGMAAVREVLVAGEPDAAAGQRPLAAVDAEPRDLPAPDPADVAVLLLSGGTTGRPKLIPRTHDDYHYNARASAEVCGLGPGDVYLAALPVSHNFPLACPGVLGTVAVGGTVVLAPTPSADDCFALVAREGVTVTAVVPPIAQLWLEEAAAGAAGDLGTLRLLQVGGARLGADAAARVRPVLGCALQQVFGMAEGLLNYTRLDDPDALVATTQGRPLSPDDEVLLVDRDGRPVPDGEPGELLTRGPYTFNGYYREPVHNERSFTPDGFFRSGDLVRRGPTGHLSVVGRVKDQINRGGEKIAAEDLEDHLAAHPAVRRVSVIGLPDDTLGERVCVCVVPADTAKPPTLLALKRFLRERGVSTLLVPDRLEITDRLPLTAVGKVDKKALVRRCSRSSET
jgi:2,3-dihydroxybenzoate-AMP ligase